jgi:fatty-acyl-CoA synthase
MEMAEHIDPTMSYWAADRSEPVLDYSVGDALRTAAAEYGARTALVDGGAPYLQRRRWTFSKLLADAEQVAHALGQRYEPGEHVAIWAPNSPEWVLLEFGAALAGLTLVTVNPAFQAAELAYVLGQSKAVGIFVAPVVRGRDLPSVVAEVRPKLPVLRDVLSLAEWPAFFASGQMIGTTDTGSRKLPAVKPDDIAQIQYTSGTTGFPKGAMLRHRGLANNGRFFARAMGAVPGDVWVNPMPLFHTAGCGLVTLGALQSGGAHVVPPGFDAATMLQLIESERGTITLNVPTMLIAMLEHPERATRDLSSWRRTGVGGAPVPVDLIRRAEQLLGLQLGIGFGQTESSPYLTHTLPQDPHPLWYETVGRPLPQTEIKIVDTHTGETVPHNALGELCARGYSLMAGYFDNPNATAAALDSDGWLHTGDLGTMDEHGYCRVQGRLKDMIIRGGENIYPREIEAVLFRHPKVADAAVIGVPDPKWGEIVVAFIRPAAAGAPSEEELTAFCRQHLAPFKTPKHWRFVDQFPQTASGKVQKFALRERFLSMSV